MPIQTIVSKSLSGVKPWEPVDEDPCKSLVKLDWYIRILNLKLNHHQITNVQEKIAAVEMNCGLLFWTLYQSRKERTIKLEAVEANEAAGIAARPAEDDFFHMLRCVRESYVEGADPDIFLARFLKIAMGPGETVPQLLVRITEQAKYCSFGHEDVQTRFIRMVLWNAIEAKDPKFGVKAKSNKWDSATVVSKWYAMQGAKEGAKLSDDYTVDDADVNRIWHGKAKPYRKQKSGNGQACKKCGGNHGKKPEDCRSYKKACFICNKEGHFSRFCYSKGKAKGKAKFKGKGKGKKSNNNNTNKITADGSDSDEERVSSLSSY